MKPANPTSGQGVALLPCPFCGGEAEQPFFGDGVQCANCHGFSKTAVGWNTRAHAKEQAAGVEREALTIALRALANYADPTGYTDNDGEPYSATDDVHPGKLAQAALEEIAALAPAPASSVGEEGERYLIRKNGYFYRPNAQGYTLSKEDAGRYTLEEAINHTHPNGPDGPRDGLSYEKVTSADMRPVGKATPDRAPEHGELASLVEALAKAHSLSINKGTSVVIDFDDPAEGFALYNAMFPFTVLSASSGGEG